MSADRDAAYRWEFACGHVTEGGNECADACPECGERDLRRKTPVAANLHGEAWAAALQAKRPGYVIGRGGRVEPLHTCTSCGRVGTRGFHHVFPDKWFCDNFKACRRRELSRA